MKHVTFPTALAPLSRAACDKSDGLPAIAYLAAHAN